MGPLKSPKWGIQYFFRQKSIATMDFSSSFGKFPAELERPLALFGKDLLPSGEFVDRVHILHHHFGEVGHLAGVIGAEGF